MAAVSLTEPLCRPCGYQEKFKADLQLKKPLEPIHLGSEQVKLEMLHLCSHLDLLIRAQVQWQDQLNYDSSPEVDSFQKQGAEIVEQMHLCLEHLRSPVPELEDYLDVVGLSALFPRVEIYIIHGSPVDMLAGPPADEYFPHAGRLQQLLALSRQLQDDLKNLGSHKYSPHQLSVIYQVLNSFKGISSLSSIKRDIEANFKQMKLSLVTEEESQQEPKLPAQYINWTLEITNSLMASVLSLSEDLMGDLNPVLSFLSTFS